MQRNIYWFLVIIAATFFIAVAVSIYELGNAEFNARETGLLGILLAIFAVVVGGIITHIYAADAHTTAIQEVSDFHQKNLRTYALKAAEKVNNLSKELGRMSSYLEAELQENSYTNPVEELHAKKERIESAIHLINTLKSVNDTSLSDWQGVIGDEINEQREIAEDREETLREVVERLAALEALQRDTSPSDLEDTTATKLQLEALRRDIRALAGEIGAPFPAIRRPPGHIRSKILEKCPNCRAEVVYRHKGKTGSRKGLTCTNCGSNLISLRLDENTFELRARRQHDETITCPACRHSSTVSLDELPGTMLTAPCIHCTANLRITRGPNAINVVDLATTSLQPKFTLTNELLDAVKQHLPPQPWPKGTAKAVAERLGLPLPHVQRAVQQLIRQGDFMDQVDGQLVTTEEKIRLIREMGAKI